MEPKLVLPRQPSGAPMLVVSILLGLLLSPVLERVLDYWMPTTATATDARQKSRGNDSGDGTTWNPRAMW